MMKTENRFALFCLVVIAFLLAGFMVETYWNCRLIKLASQRKCMPGSGPVAGPGISTNPTLR
jgi:hypothetical protein